MSVISCDIYKLVFNKAHALPVLKSLVLTKGFEFIDPVFEAQNSEKVDGKIIRIKEELSVLEKSITFLLGDKPVPATEISNKSVEKTIANYNEVITGARELAAQLVKKEEIDTKNSQGLINKNDMVLDDKLEKVDYLPENLRVSELFYKKVIKVEKSKFPFLVKEAENIKPINMQILNEDNSELTVVLLSMDSDSGFVDGFLEQYKSEIISIEEQLISQMGDSMQTTTNLSQSIKLAEIRVDTDLKLNDVKTLYDLLSLELMAYENSKYVGKYSGEDEKNKIGKLVEVSGWANPEAKNYLDELVKTLGVGAELVKLPSDHRNDVRTEMSNNALFRPFEIVTQFMGVPGTNELDPSPLLAFFFVVFFGFALGDAGYGFLMLIGLLYFLLFKKPQGMIREGIKLMIYCSVSTVIFGALTGGWFGVDVNVVGGSFGGALRDMKQIDLQSSIILVLGMSLVAGFIQQLFGVFLEMVTYFKNKDIIGGIAGPGTWLLLLFTMVLLALGSFSDALSFIKPIQTYIIAIVLILFAFGQGRSQKHLLLKPLVGIGSLFNITGYLSNTLSYARLLALGLATGVIASVINLIATILGGTDSVFGLIVTALILIVGHLFNIALNVLGTFVNIIRLQLVEFFPRFYEAKGVAIESKTFVPNYIKLPKDPMKFGALFINISNLFVK